MKKNKKNDKAKLENKRQLFFLIGLVLALSLVLFAFEWKTNETNKLPNMGTSSFEAEEFIFIPPTHSKEKEEAKPKIEVPSFEIVSNETDVEDIDFYNPDPEDPVLTTFNPIILEPTDNPKDEEEVFDFAEVMPEFPGGMRALLHFLSKNIKYPPIAQQNGVEGKVYVRFVVNETGDVSNVQIARGVDKALNNEALRVVKKMPRWNPGRQKGRAVKVWYNVPINFKLN